MRIEVTTARLFKLYMQRCRLEDWHRELSAMSMASCTAQLSRRFAGNDRLTRNPFAKMPTRLSTLLVKWNSVLELISDTDG